MDIMNTIFDRINIKNDQNNDSMISISDEFHQYLMCSQSLIIKKE